MNKSFNNNHKIILIGIAAVIIMFVVYHVKFSPYNQCVNAFLKAYGKNAENDASAKIACMKN